MVRPASTGGPAEASPRRLWAGNPLSLPAPMITTKVCRHPTRPREATATTISRHHQRRSHRRSIFLRRPGESKFNLLCLVVNGWFDWLRRVCERRDSFGDSRSRPFVRFFLYTVLPCLVCALIIPTLPPPPLPPNFGRRSLLLMNIAVNVPSLRVFYWLHPILS